MSTESEFNQLARFVSTFYVEKEDVLLEASASFLGPLPFSLIGKDWVRALELLAADHKPEARHYCS